MSNKKFAVLLMTILTLITTAISLGCLQFSIKSPTESAKFFTVFSMFSGIGAAGCLWVLVVMITDLFENEEK